MTIFSTEEILHMKYQIYSFRRDNPWISNRKVANHMGRSISTINRYAKKAEEEDVILNPQAKLKPHPDIKAALLSFKNKYHAFDELKACEGIRYLCMYHGDWDIRAVYDSPVDFASITGHEKTVAEGVIGPAITPRSPYILWEDCFEKMDAFVDRNEKITESSIEVQPRIPDWDEEDWTLYYYFTIDLRRNFNTLRKKHVISWRKYQEWKKGLEEYCTIVVAFFPDGAFSYNDMTLSFKTRYEQYVADLFSYLPTTPLFYKIGEYFTANIFIPKEYDKLPRVYNIISRLLASKIISDYRDGYGVMAYWNPR